MITEEESKIKDDYISRLEIGNKILLERMITIQEKIALMKANCLKLDPTLEAIEPIKKMPEDKGTR